MNQGSNEWSTTKGDQQNEQVFCSRRSRHRRSQLHRRLGRGQVQADEPGRTQESTRSCHQGFERSGRSGILHPAVAGMVSPFPLWQREDQENQDRGVPEVQITSSSMTIYIETQQQTFAVGFFLINTKKKYFYFGDVLLG